MIYFHRKCSSVVLLYEDFRFLRLPLKLEGASEAVKFFILGIVELLVYVAGVILAIILLIGGKVHDRMPLILMPNDAKGWLFTEKYKEMLAPKMLLRSWFSCQV